MLYGGGGHQKFALYIFDLRIQPGFSKQIYLIFLFGQEPRKKYIQYLYAVRLLEMNILDIRTQLAF